MRDKRPVDDLSIQELERILAIRKREARLSQLRRYEDAGRVVARDQKPLVHQTVNEPVPPPAENHPVPEPQAAIQADPHIPDEYYEADPLFEDQYEARRKRRARSKRTSQGTFSFGKVWNRLLLVVQLLEVRRVAIVFL